MARIQFNAGTLYCYDCVNALRKFIGSMNGIADVEVENGLIVVNYDEGVIEEERVRQITRDTVERLGYKLIDA